MPLCTLKIPQNVPLDLEVGTRVCHTALERLLQDFNIPNPEDREIRIVRVDDLEKPELEIGYTIGPHEYPGFEPESLYPTEDQVNSAGTAIQKFAKEELNIDKTTISAWEKTSFLICSPENAAPVFEKLEGDLNLPKDLPTIRLFLSPEAANQSIPHHGKEGSPSKEADQFISLGREIANHTSEILNIPGLRTEIIDTEAADCQMSVEIDCPGQPNNETQSEASLQLSKNIEQSLLKHEGSSEVWVRLHSPEYSAVFS